MDSSPRGGAAQRFHADRILGCCGKGKGGILNRRNSSSAQFGFVPTTWTRTCFTPKCSSPSGGYAEADWQYRLAVTLDPYASNAHSFYGEFLFKQERLEEAQTQFEAAIREDPVPEACDGLGDIYQRWNQPALAEQSFRLAVKYNPSDSHAHFALGAIAAASGRTAEALREYQAGLETDPANAEALNALHKLQRRKVNFGTAAAPMRNAHHNDSLA